MGAMSDKYYFCLNHHTVEGEDGCRAADRMGPYDTSEQASHALETAAERTEAWESDPDWNDTEPNGSARNDSAVEDKPTE